MTKDEYAKINVERKDGGFRWYRIKQIGCFDVCDTGTSWKPSVTTILNVIAKGVGFDQWMGNQPSYKAACEERDVAGKRGTIVHESIEKLLKGEEVEAPNEEISKHLMCFKKFYDENDIEVLDQEIFLISPDYGFAGTPDLICKTSGKIWLIDYKTGNQYKTHPLQCRMYALLYEAIFGIEIDCIAGLYTKSTWIKEPNYTLKRFVYTDKAKEKYDACIEGAVALWNYTNGTAKLADPYPKDKPNIETIFKLGGKTNGTSYEQL